MRLWKFSTTVTGLLTLPSADGRSEPVNRFVRLRVANTAGGPVIETMGGSVKQLERVTHTGTYIHPTIGAQQAILGEWESNVGVSGTLHRATTDDDTSPTITETTTAYLERFRVLKSSEDINGSSFTMTCSFTFVIDPSGDWS